MTAAFGGRLAFVFRPLALAACAVLLPAGSAWSKDDGKAANGARANSLTVCAVPSSMPRMGKSRTGSPEGIDVAVAQAVARVLGRSLEFHWCASADCSWHCLPESRCDLVIGQPHGSGPPRAVAWSVPYAGAQFGLVVLREGRSVHSLADVRGKRVGVVAGTVALADNDYVVVRLKSRDELLEKVHSRELDAAVVDGDFAAWFLHEHPDVSLRLVSEYVPREHWNMAFAVRSADSSLLTEINRAVAELAKTHELQKIYARYGVLLHEPFVASAEPGPAASVDTWRRIKARGELVVSFDPANLPYSSAKDDRPGFDVELARSLAARLAVKLRIDWIDTQHETAVGRLLENHCDLVFGEAVAANVVAGDEELTGKILYSRPYYVTGYVLVQRQSGPHVRSLSELKGAKAERLGTEAGSVADYSLRQRGYGRRLFRNQLATLTALNAGAIDHAYLWANVAWLLHVSPDLKLDVIPTDAGEDRWNIAVAMRREDTSLKREVDAALGALIDDGTVARILERYHMPTFAASGPLNDKILDHRGATIHHTAPDRGTEPQTQKVQTSKRAYSGLARVQSAGELVVGLDHNNLPFSTAHPAPGGLDYEIAGLLAQRLGVRLRVFWAISSHDSYPAKLSARGLCDVILGVTPDDRFQERVLYSKPYYYAKYLWVVPAGRGFMAGPEPVAVEQGVAVRALKDRAVCELPSTDAVLQAVATEQVKMGYVVGARGQWLAHERWPGKLAFQPAADSLDTLPITAAVRKNDSDLKEAIDRAWDELGRSGELAAAFARWHIVDERAMARTQAESDDAPANSPVKQERTDLSEGQALFRGLCTGCHGGTGRGGKGPDLTDNRWIHGNTDRDIASVIQNGVPKTTMKKLGDALKPDQIRKLIAYIRSLARSPGESTWKPYMAGDPAAGRSLFFDAQSKAQCVKCHSVGGEGGRIGPTLDRIASRRAPEFLIESILQPSQDIAPEYEAVIVATKDGRTITGLRNNETNFSIQLTEENGRFHSFLKRDLDEVRVLKKSLMPENFPDLLTVKQFHDIVAYLLTLE
jgi:polar amino acid transport system substrate-binding protein